MHGVDDIDEVMMINEHSDFSIAHFIKNQLRLHIDKIT